ncbi:phage portal protein [Neomegalonema perideroedes]|uniref:phage portal protein n=1 Tax=Neomegalonema perideroedes TaxID=217219 RepID=UPI00037C7D43|nr:phage portal protein [Neomegalonema perideroedes]
MSFLSFNLSRLLGRSPGAASSPPQKDPGWFGLREIGRGRRGGLPRVSEDSALAHGTVYACVNAIAQDMAKVPLHLYRRTKSGDKERVYDHPALEALTIQSSEGVPAIVARYALQWAVSLRGNAFAFIRRGGDGRIKSLETIHNDHVSIYRNGSRRYYDFEDAEGERRRVGWRDMLHLRLCAEDGWLGRSPLAVASHTMALALGAQAHAGRHVTEREAIRAVVEHPDWFQDDDEARRHAQRIRNALDDPEANGIPILPFGMSFKTVGLSPADEELLAQRRFDREQIATIYRVPPAKAGIYEHGLKGSVEQQAIDYVTDCLLGWAKLNEDHFRLALLTEEERRSGLRFEYLFDGLMRATTRERIEAFVRAAGGPYMTRAEARSASNLPWRADAEGLLPPPNMAALPEQESEDE